MLSIQKVIAAIALAVAVLGLHGVNVFGGALAVVAAIVVLLTTKWNWALYGIGLGCLFLIGEGVVNELDPFIERPTMRMIVVFTVGFLSGIVGDAFQPSTG